MGRQDELRAQMSELDKQKKPLEEELRKIYLSEQEECEKRVNKCNSLQDKFTLDELRFAAYARCDCGAGLAYPKNIGPRGSWHCSDILLGRAVPSGLDGSKKHTEGLPFMFYEIKSEDQSSANGVTTRPKE